VYIKERLEIKDHLREYFWMGISEQHSYLIQCKSSRILKLFSMVETVYDWIGFLNDDKSQGQTFDKICPYLPRRVSSEGKLYVALSRVRSFDSLSVVSEKNPEIGNCVFREIFH
jgi:hypothetical protein